MEGLVAQKLLEIHYIKHELEQHKDPEVRAIAANLGAIASCLTSIVTPDSEDSTTSPWKSTSEYSLDKVADAVSAEDLTGHEGFM